jgi:hypothetical protein
MGVIPSLWFGSRGQSESGKPSQRSLRQNFMQLHLAVTLSIYGHHFRKTCRVLGL